MFPAVHRGRRIIVSQKSIGSSGNPAFFPFRRLFHRLLFAAFLISCLLGRPEGLFSQDRKAIDDKPDQTKTSGATQKANGLGGVTQTSLFDGKELGYWKKSDFYQAGRVFIKDGCLILERSEWMTGVTWTGPLFRIDYEIRFEAMRVEGNDFFCGLTFPVGKSACTLILGGWHNRVSGLSTLDHKDASLNETTLETSLENNRWYKVILRVTRDKIQAALDGEWIVDVDTAGKNIDIRTECIPNLPLGFATYKTTGSLRNIHLTRYPLTDP